MGVQWTCRMCARVFKEQLTKIKEDSLTRYCIVENFIRNVLWLFANIFPVKLGGMASFDSTSEQFAKVYFAKILIRKNFLSQKYPALQYIACFLYTLTETFNPALLG